MVAELRWRQEISVISPRSGARGTGPRSPGRVASFRVRHVVRVLVRGAQASNSSLCFVGSRVGVWSVDLSH